MSKIIVKGIQLMGRIASAADKYYDAPQGPIHYEAQESFVAFEKLLRAEGQPVVPLEVRLLPFIEDGCITSNAASSCYILNQCLVANDFSPSFSSDTHIVRIAARLEDKARVQEIFDRVKEKAPWNCRKYWADYEKDKFVEVPGKLENMAGLIQYVPKLFQDKGGRR